MHPRVWWNRPLFYLLPFIPVWLFNPSVPYSSFMSHPTILQSYFVTRGRYGRFPYSFFHTPSPALWFLPCSCIPSCLNLSTLSILFLYIHFPCTPLSPHTFGWLFGSLSFWLSLGSASSPQASLNKILRCACVPPEFLCWKHNPQTLTLVAFLDVAFEKNLASFEVMGKGPMILVAL